MVVLVLAVLSKGFLIPPQRLVQDTARTGRSSHLLRASWVDTRVQLEIPATAEECYGLYSDLVGNMGYST